MIGLCKREMGRYAIGSLHGEVKTTAPQCDVISICSYLFDHHKIEGMDGFDLDCLEM